MIASEVREYRFEFQHRYLPMLALLGVTPATAKAVIGPADLDVRFGVLRCRTPLTNIRCVQLTGPYKAIKAIGARASFADTGATFGTTTAGGVCVEFRHPVKALDPTGTITHEALTLTVADREQFAAALKVAAGLLPG
jgi:hypothetical protein